MVDVFTTSGGVSFRLIDEPSCRFCNTPMDPDKVYPRCYSCHKIRTELGISYAFDQARSAGVYSEARSNAFKTYILRAKRDPSAAKTLAEVMAHVLKSRLPHMSRVDIIGCVPMSTSKLEMKGFNQAAALASEVGKRVDIPVAPGLLQVVTEPPMPQHKSNLRERFENVKGCFAVGTVPNGIETVLLVDDTFTTGATVHECAKMLKGAGVSRVFVLSAARAVWVTDKSPHLEVYFGSQ